MRYARLDNNIVAEIVVTDSVVGKYHPNIKFVECTESAEIGHSYDGTGFIPPAPEIPQIPQTCLPLQGLLALDQAGLASAYTAWANDPARTFSERAFIDKSMIWHRSSPVLIAAATSLGLTDAQIDDLFELAVTL